MSVSVSGERPRLGLLLKSHFSLEVDPQLYSPSKDGSRSKTKIRAKILNVIYRRR